MNPELSIILPCRNEEAALNTLLKEIKAVIQKNNLSTEIIVSDSSQDQSSNIALQNKVKLVKHDKRGYGIAIQEGIQASSGTYILIMDADLSYNPEYIPHFLEELRKGSDVVMGHRKRSLMEPQSMPWLHKHIGNPLLSFILRICTGTRVRDAHCGMRAITKKAYERLQLHTIGMEFASEFVLEAHRKNMHITEIPISYHARSGTSKLRTFRDGWRHLRFILLYSPGFLFFIPGITIISTGAGLLLYVLIYTLDTQNLFLIFQQLIVSTTAIITGYQLVIFAVFARSYAGTHLGHETRYLSWIYKHLSIEKVGSSGMLVIIAGLVLLISNTNLLPNTKLDEIDGIKILILSLLLIVIGVQTIFSSFMLSLLGIQKK